MDRRRSPSRRDLPHRRLRAFRHDPIWDLRGSSPSRCRRSPTTLPPHEGAMFDLPYVAAPPDVIRVEVLQTLPGRPISGERLDTSRRHDLFRFLW